ncbi:MAG: LysR substrate-binding domain-containing protein [Steroidobacteraceae bacterium]|jgi:LysR family transcriptional regulator, cys regulon transcriptional activator
MKLHQLRYLAAIADCDLNITTASKKLHTSQPGVSRQIQLLESELGFELFVRQGRALVGLTPAGEHVVKRAHRILHEIHTISRLSDELNGKAGGTLSIGTTHTQARYVLPDVIRAFRKRHPSVKLHLHQGTSEQIADMMRANQIDLAIATGSEALFPDVTFLPSYRWHRTLVVPVGHPLATGGLVKLRQLAEFPIITYTFSFSGPSSLNDIFTSEGLEANVVLTARDADVIKTYVRLDLGVGIVARMAIDPVDDEDLVAVSAEHLFPVHTTWIGFRRGSLLRGYMFDFVELFAPHLSRDRVERASEAADPQALEKIFADFELPLR